MLWPLRVTKGLGRNTAVLRSRRDRRPAQGGRRRFPLDAPAPRRVRPFPFNRMEEWGPDGRIAQGASVYSPFLRRKKRLALE